MRKSLKYIVLALSLMVSGYIQAQLPKAENGTFVLKNATIETVTKGTLQNATLVISEGKIADVGTNIAVPANAKTIDCSGLIIYPGMIDGGTFLGLNEITYEARTNDKYEIGDVIPQVQALTAVNPSSVLIPVARVSGVTNVLTMPGGGLFPGTAALISLYGYTPDQMYAGFKGVVLNYPMKGRRSKWDRRKDEEIEKDHKKKMKVLDDAWSKAVQYHKIDAATNGKKQEYYPEMEALLPVVRKKMKLLVNVNTADDILSALKWVKKNDVEAIFCGVAEGWRVADSIAKANIPVIVGPVLSNPTRKYDRYDRPYANAGILMKAGVKVAIRTTETENVRNLPYHAGFAATYGMGKENALKSITINAAEIFGVEKMYGSIEKGKKASIFVVNGDPFETKTQVRHLFIDGWKIPLVNRQTMLRDEYMDRARK